MNIYCCCLHKLKRNNVISYNLDQRSVFRIGWGIGEDFIWVGEYFYIKGNIEYLLFNTIHEVNSFGNCFCSSLHNMKLSTTNVRVYLLFYCIFGSMIILVIFAINSETYHSGISMK